MKRRIVAVSLAILAMTALVAAQDVAGEWQFKRRAREGAHAGTIIRRRKKPTVAAAGMHR